MYQVIFATPPLKIEMYKGEENLLEHVKNIEYGYASNGVLSNQPSADSHILNQSEFKNLKLFFESCIEDYLKDIFLSESKLKITQSWVNKTDKGTMHKMHYHPNSVLSGVYYFNTHSSPIQFISDRKDQFLLADSAHYNTENKRVNEFVSTSFTLSAQENMLVIFPSYINHTVPPNQSDSVRYSLSFNTFPVFELGSIDSMTHVNFSPEMT